MFALNQGSYGLTTIINEDRHTSHCNKALKSYKNSYRKEWGMTESDSSQLRIQWSMQLRSSHKYTKYRRWRYYFGANVREGKEQRNLCERKMCYHNIKWLFFLQTKGQEEPEKWGWNGSTSTWRKICRSSENFTLPFRPCKATTSF